MTRRTTFLIGLLVQLVAVFGLFLPYVWLAKSGELISLRTVPVDPRSIFRGDYVVLGYEAGRDTAQMSDPQMELQYVVLEKKGDFHERVAVSATKPTLQPGQVCLRGYRDWTGITFPDIGQYFVEEGMGVEFEHARNAHRLIVDAYVNSDCAAVIRGVRLGPEAPEGIMDPWAGQMETKPVMTTGSTVPVR